MRLSGSFIGIAALGLLLLLTALCSVLTYGATRTTIIDLWDSGLRVESPQEVLTVLLNPNAVTPAPSPTPATQELVIVLPSPTPLITTPNTISTPDNTALVVTTPLTPPLATPVPIVEQSTPTLDPSQEFRWSDPRQIRILLMGIDQRSATGDRGPFRSDTMMVLNVDPVRKTAGVISFPRDLWVDIPTSGPERINTANRTGDLIAYPGGGGPALAMETIAANFGIRVDKYVLINFDVFERVVDILAPNGVEVCITEVIRDPDYPDSAFGIINVEFDPGCQRLNATRLLQYARTRATQGGDFDRARRQQETVEALRRELLSVGGVANFLTQIPALYDELANNYRTNLTLNELIRLGFLVNEIDPANIRYAVIDQNYVDLGKAPDGSDILLPYWSRINDLIQRVFYPQIEVDTADLRTRSQAENASIQVYNGTAISGLAGRTQEWLVARGISVSGIGNDPNHNGQATVIKDYGNHRWTAQYLAQVLGLPPERIRPGTDGLASSGIIIVVGPDIQTLLGGQ